MNETGILSFDDADRRNIFLRSTDGIHKPCRDLQAAWSI